MSWLTWTFLLLGAAGIVGGLRGRTVAREPHCKSCGYLLSGLQHTPHSVCPECGHNIWIGIVMRRRRIRRTWMVRLAFILVFLAFASASLQLLERLTGIQWDRFRSVESLKSEISDTSAKDDHSYAWRELSRRSSQRLLSVDDSGDVAAIAIDRHLQLLRMATTLGSLGSRSLAEIFSTWQPVPQWEHAKWIQLARRNRLLTAAQFAAYVQALFEPEVDAQPQAIVQPGKPCIVTMVMHGRGLGGFESIEVVAMIEAVMLDGRPIRVEFNDWYMPVQVMSATRDRSMETSAQTAITLNAAPGMHELTIQTRYGVTCMSVGSGPAAFELGGRADGLELWPPTILEATTRNRVRVEVLDVSR
jgi:predicted RNA-binding Zn-ribbon protein involved in translation (DUF1610 family)